MGIKNKLITVLKDISCAQNITLNPFLCAAAAELCHE